MNNLRRNERRSLSTGDIRETLSPLATDWPDRFEQRPPKLAPKVYRVLLHGPELSERAKAPKIPAAQSAALKAAMAK